MEDLDRPSEPKMMRRDSDTLSDDGAAMGGAPASHSAPNWLGGDGGSAAERSTDGGSDRDDGDDNEHRHADDSVATGEADAAGAAPSSATTATTAVALAPRALLAAGNGSAGQLGLRGVESVREPTLTSAGVLGVADGNELVSLSVSALHTLVVRGDGVVWSSGSNEFGQLGRPGQSGTVLRPLESLPQRVLQVAVGDRFSFARSSSGRLFSWGLNESGQLGQGHRDTVLKPRPVKDIPGNRLVRNVACGSQHVLAVCNGGELLVWGSSRFGQLGNGTYASSTTPVLCKFLTNDGVQGIACGSGHCMVRVVPCLG
jgi:alpha-tubulin suppressor-like RCC1 family protein